MDHCASADHAPLAALPAHVLLVDDNQPLLEFLVLLLEGEGLRLTAVNSPLQAAMLARQTRFDLIISDVRMPHLSGPELLAEIRRTASNQSIPAILISGQASIELGDWLPDSSNTHYLRKPFGGNDLIELIHRTLQLPLVRP
jgi:CheY-like chemotaxis protein